MTNSVKKNPPAAESPATLARTGPFTEEQARLITIALVFLAAIAAGFVLHVAAIILVPFVFAVFITSIVSPILYLFEVRFRFPRGWAVAFTMLVVIALISVFGVLMVSILQTVVQSFSTYSASIEQLIKRFVDPLVELGIPIDPAKVGEELRRNLSAFNGRGFSAVQQFITQSVLTMILTGFLLAGHDPRKVREGIMAEIDTRVRKYLVIKVLISGITGFLVWLLLWLLGLPLALVFGVLAFALNFIPTIGSIIATALPVPLAMVHFHDPWSIIAVVALPGVIQMMMGNVLEPKLMGQGMNLHPVVVIISLAVWSILWGPIGMILAVPMTAVVRFVLLEFETTRDMADLLAGKIPVYKFRGG